MTIKTISVNARVVKNLGNYNSVHLEAGCEVALDLDDVHQDSFQKAWNIVSEQINTQMKDFIDEDKNSRVQKGLR